KLNEEMMRLYKDRGVNPLAGCLPMLLQIPVLIALYSVLRFPQHPPHFPENSTLQHRINAAVSLQHPGNPSSFAGMNLLCNAQQEALGRSLPLISIFWGFIVPSGVILYWTTSNLVQIGQQHFLLRAGHLREPILGDGKAGDGKASGGDGRRGEGDGRRGPAP